MKNIQSQPQLLLRRFRLAFFCLLLLSSIGAATAYAQKTTSPLSAPTGYVNDYAGVIDPAAKQQMETILTNLKTRGNIEFAVVTVPTTGNQDIFDYSLAVARGWGIGSSEGEKNGLLLLVAVNDHKYYVQVSRHLEGDLPDGYVGEIGRRMRDPFRANRYGEGLLAAVQTLVATLGQKRGFSVEGIDQQKFALRESYAGDNSGGLPRNQKSGISTCTIIFIIFIILLVILSSRRGGGGGGCLNLLLLNSLLNSGGGGRSSGGWSSGGGGGGFGGFGGGGDFGGGGSGGSW